MYWVSPEGIKGLLKNRSLKHDVCKKKIFFFIPVFLQNDDELWNNKKNNINFSNKSECSSTVRCFRINNPNNCSMYENHSEKHITNFKIQYILCFTRKREDVFFQPLNYLVRESWQFYLSALTGI